MKCCRIAWQVPTQMAGTQGIITDHRPEAWAAHLGLEAVARLAVLPYLLSEFIKQLGAAGDLLLGFLVYLRHAAISTDSLQRGRDAGAEAD